MVATVDVHRRNVLYVILSIGVERIIPSARSSWIGTEFEIVDASKVSVFSESHLAVECRIVRWCWRKVLSQVVVRYPMADIVWVPDFTCCL